MFSTATNGILPTIDLNGNNNNGMWDNGAWWIIVILALVWSGNGFGFGNGFGGGFGGGYGTPQFMSTFDTDYLSQGLRDIQSNLASDFLTLNNEILSGVCDVRGDIANSTASITNAVTNGFNTQNLANLQNTNSINSNINANMVAAMQNTYALQASLAQMASDNRADTAQLAYNQATNTCAINTNASNNTRDIVEAVNAGNRAILDAMAQNKVEAMQDKINSLQDQLQTANFLASQAAQNNYLVDQLAPKAPIPAYNVPNPYAGCGCNSCGCNMV